MTETTAKKFGISSFVLHIAAMLFMLCDHVWAILLFDVTPLAYIGRIAFPIFAFMLAEGFFHTKNHKKYLLRMLIFAVISEIPFNLLVGGGVFYLTHQNVLWTFSIALCAMLLLKQLKNRSLVVRCICYPLIVLIAFLVGFVTFVDYFGYGVITVLLFYFTYTTRKDSLIKRLIMMLIQLAVIIIINCEMLGGVSFPFELFGYTFDFPTQYTAVLALPIIWLYNGAQGPYNKFIKYLYYSFYPLHMLILAIVAMFM